MNRAEARTVLIVGGGVGGLTGALAFARRGFDVHVFEQAAHFDEIGAGIQLSPNCLRVLFDLGLELRLRNVSFVPEGTQMRDWKNGNIISAHELGAAAVAAYGYPYFHVHRADLMDVLVGHARESPNVHLHANARCEAFEQTRDGVTASVGGKLFRGALLIGADGIHSSVRTQLFGAESPRFTGNVAWRGMVNVARLPRGLVHPVATIWMGPGKHFVHYYVRSGRLVNCICVIERRGREEESWTERGELADLKRDFAGWHETVQELIRNMDDEDCYRWALFDRNPMRRWSEGCVTLLGDACHPTLPFMAQGAAMAIEDAAVLVGCVSGADDVAEALMRYESLRRSRTARIQLGSRNNAKLFHLRPPYAWVRNRALSSAKSNPMDWVFRYDALSATRER
jgi:salicylate hydroxylase